MIFVYGKMATNLDVQAHVGTTAPPGVCITKRVMAVHGRKEPNEAADDHKTFFFAASLR